LERILFVNYPAVVRSKTGVILRTGAGEIAENLKVRSAIQVALIERQDKTKAPPTEIGFQVLHRIDSS
jgi:hypothetical protein